MPGHKYSWTHRFTKTKIALHYSTYFRCKYIFYRLFLNQFPSSLNTCAIYALTYIYTQRWKIKYRSYSYFRKFFILFILQLE